MTGIVTAYVVLELRQNLRQFTCSYLLQKACPRRDSNPRPLTHDLDTITTTLRELVEIRRNFWSMYLYIFYSAIFWALKGGIISKDIFL